jgi:hypothetical protein
MKSVIGAIAIFLIVTAMLVVLFISHRPMWLVCRHELKTGQQIISRVEVFQKENGRLPESSKELGFEDPDEKVFYQKISDDEYCLWFGTTLGESETYRSHNRRWEEGRECI